MESYRREPQPSRAQNTVNTRPNAFWKELLEQSIGGWTQTDQTLEHALDRLEKDS